MKSIRIVLLVVIAAGYGYAELVAIGNVFGVAQIAGSLGGLTPLGTVMLALVGLLPLAVAVLGWMLTRKTPVWRPLALGAGLALVALLQLEIMHLVPFSRYVAGA